jgi:hypothetical protein
LDYLKDAYANNPPTIKILKGGTSMAPQESSFCLRKHDEKKEYALQ